ncbi:MAG: glutamine--fructose-6-phosphate aminotransferase, partial [Deltaproteobacteria bacterium]|nr:glutamine--fructose-6-phosphate aminotransferase [Deltaproteobacteria bacterium]
MCGIVGYIGREGNASEVLLDGLRRLEYRGYDSAGVAIFDGDVIDVRRAEGKLMNLEGEIRTAPI